MRTDEEMFNIIIKTAREDDRIEAVMLNGSRADPEAEKDIFQDFDIVYFVKDVSPFYDNKKWLEERFGRVILMQTPETGTLIKPDGLGDFIYLAIFEDGIRLDLRITQRPYDNNGEPAKVLLDKTGILKNIVPDPEFWHVGKPTEKEFSDCCNEFWWCLNNVAKGAARAQEVYAMDMLNRYVRDMLNIMCGWYIGVDAGFSVSPGKAGKNFKKYLGTDIYIMYLKTYSSADGLVGAAYNMADLFSFLAHTVASALGFKYNEDEEKGLRKYFKMAMNNFNAQEEII